MELLEFAKAIGAELKVEVNVASNGSISVVALITRNHERAREHKSGIVISLSGFTKTPSIDVALSSLAATISRRQLRFGDDSTVYVAPTITHSKIEAT